MAAVTHACSIHYAAKMLGEDAALLEAIISNDDNLIYCHIVCVYLGPGETISALTHGGTEEPANMIRSARITLKNLARIP